MRTPKPWLATTLVVCLLSVLLGAIAQKYVWLYFSRRPDPGPPVADLLGNAETVKNPELLLPEANRLAWFFNWPKARPLYLRAQELFKQTVDNRNETYARRGRIRAQSETRASVDVSEMVGLPLDLPIP